LNLIDKIKKCEQGIQLVFAVKKALLGAAAVAVWPVWTVLYIIIVITFGAMFYRTFIGAIGWAVALPFILNLVFNFSFTSIQFGLKNNFLAALDILLTLATLIWMLIAIFPYARG